MSGIEILATEEVVTKFAMNMTAFWTAGGILCIICVILGIFMSIEFCEWKSFLVLGLTGLIFGLLFGSLAGAAFRTPTEYETQYKVTISDEVSMNEFLEKYEIIDQEGKILTIRERE